MKKFGILAAILLLVVLGAAAIYYYWGQQIRTMLFYTESQQPTIISGTVTAADDGELAGVVLIEQGRLYGRNYQFGGRVDKDGTFSVELPGGGDYGIHIYATGYIYLPLSIHIEAGKDNVHSFSLPPNPAEKHAPQISDVRFEQDGGKTIISMRVEDPDNNLSHQVLGLNSETQEGFILPPPKFVLPWSKNYPEGIYTLEYETGKGKTDPEKWIFVAADNRCYNSPVMIYPFDKNSYIKAHSGEKKPAKEPAEGAEATGREQGRKIFQANCAVCHFPESPKIKVGPGLAGLFKMEKTPVREKPVSEVTIRKQIVSGGADMPPYAHIEEKDLSMLIAYLKTL